MADTQLTQSGAEVQADLDKVEGLANIKTIGNGLSLSSTGELSASGGGGGTTIYKHIVRVNSSYELVLYACSNTAVEYDSIMKELTLPSNILNGELRQTPYGGTGAKVIGNVIYINYQMGAAITYLEEGTITLQTLTINSVGTDSVTAL